MDELPNTQKYVHSTAITRWLQKRHSKISMELLTTRRISAHWTTKIDRIWNVIDAVRLDTSDAVDWGSVDLVLWACTKYYPYYINPFAIKSHVCCDCLWGAGVDHGVSLPIDVMPKKTRPTKWHNLFSRGCCSSVDLISANHPFARQSQWDSFHPTFSNEKYNYIDCYFTRYFIHA